MAPEITDTQKAYLFPSVVSSDFLFRVREKTKRYCNAECQNICNRLADPKEMKQSAKTQPV